MREPRPEWMRKGAMEAGRMITDLMTSESSSNKPVIRTRYQLTLPISLLPQLAIGGSPQRVGSSRDNDQGRCFSILPLIAVMYRYAAYKPL